MTSIFVIMCGTSGFFGGLLAGEMFLLYRQNRIRTLNRLKKNIFKPSDTAVMAR